MLSLLSLLPSFTFASVLSLHGLRKRSLSPSGASCAFVVGFCMFAGPLRAFGGTLIVFYVVGSKATKFGKQLKARLEDGHHEAGYRTASQVLCNSLSAFIASIVWNVLFVPESIPSMFASGLFFIEPFPYDGKTWCPLSVGISHGWSRRLLFATLGHFGCCMGDTLASELGILSATSPILITTLKPVPPGTNGALSVLGTLASIGGGLLMGLTLAASLVVENMKCREDWVKILTTLFVYGSLAGLLGSLIDSLLGATIQRTRYSRDSKLILQEDSEGSAGPGVQVISGLDILTNNQVNLISSTLTAIVLGWMSV